MKNNVNLLLLVILMFSFSCERDDICSEDTATTPHLIIRFYDIENQSEFKNVSALKISGLDDDGTVLDEISVTTTNPDSIVLPLRFQNEGELTITRFQLEKDSNLSEAGNSNIDIIEVSYTPEFIYVSRACGYKSIFDLVPVSGVIRENDSDNWISSAEIINQTIENESEAHVIIYH
ncbi:hypothetical protein A9Q86_13260 [Flavobacteriales bacterium 33_180_T64]|nr:hypothetical protein A9Q86_13260 [Flavobacteriales bacterium 33_180_T64]